MTLKNCAKNYSFNRKWWPIGQHFCIIWGLLCSSLLTDVDCIEGTVCYMCVFVLRFHADL